MQRKEKYHDIAERSKVVCMLSERELSAGREKEERGLELALQENPMV